MHHKFQKSSEKTLIITFLLNFFFWSQISAQSPQNYLNDRFLQSVSYYKNEGNDWAGTCSNGGNQSPISITGIKGDCNANTVFDLNFPLTLVSTKLLNTGYNLSANAGNLTFGTLYATDINGNLLGYDCKQLALHAPGEHILDSNTANLELQLFYIQKSEFNVSSLNSGYDTAIVSILYDVDDSQDPDPFIANLSIASLNNSNMTVNFSLLNSQFASQIEFYTYQGSLTTPPCKENVNWYIINQRLTLTSSQLNIINAYYMNNYTYAAGNGNNRATQNLNGRTIVKGGMLCEDQFVYFFSFFILYIFINYFIFKLL